MSGIQTILPSARVFTGPGDRLFGYDRIWVIIYAGIAKTARINAPTTYDPGHHLIKGRCGHDGSDLELITHILQQATKEAAYAGLHETLQNGWHKSDPWNYQPSQRTGDPHVALMSDTPLVWTVDFDRNRIFYDREGHHLTWNFSLPEHLPIRLTDFQPYTPMQLPIASSKQVSSMCSTKAAPQDDAPQVLFDMVYRLASDYERTWRTAGLTIKRYGLHPLAMGILSCLTMNFDMRKISAAHQKQHPDVAQFNFSDLLRWRAWPGAQVVSTVSFGETQVIFTERMDLATSLVHEHFNTMITSQPFGVTRDSHKRHRRLRCNITVHYIVTSIREIQYFTKTLGMGPIRMTCTPVIPFFDGVDPPSETAVRWLLNAIYGQAYPHVPLLQKLPVELQEMIIDYACPPPDRYDAFDRAVFAARLGLGASFNFRTRGRAIVLCAPSEDGEMQPAELKYQLRFWDRYVGLTYQVDGDTTKQSPPSRWSEDDTKWHIRYKAFWQK